MTIKLAERVLLPGQSAWPAQDPLDSLELPPICVRASPLSPDRLASLAWRCLGDNSTSALGVVGAVSLLPRGVWQVGFAGLSRCCLDCFLFDHRSPLV